MPKALCLFSLAIAILIMVLFLIDAVMKMAGMPDSAPLRGASLLMDLTFIIVGITVAVMSWLTFKEQP
ncbi:MAG: hypothetical protein WD119_02925 [Pirellulaceae bacterium]